MKRIVLTFLLVSILTPALQATLTTVTDFVDVRSGFFGGYIWDTAIGWERDLTWTHMNPYTGDYEDALDKGVIQKVTLSIYARLITDVGQDLDQVAITFTDSGRDGPPQTHELWMLPPDSPTGYLKNGWTNYSLDPRWLNGVEVEAAVDYQKSFRWDFIDDAYVKYSALSVTYDYDLAAAPPADPIPAPGSIIMGGIGIGLIGWLRRKKTI